MNRASATTYLATRFGQYLSAASRPATDSTGALKEIIDDALFALGVTDADLLTWQTTDPDGAEDVRAQLAYRALLQLNRDLAVQFDVSSQGDSVRLSQMRAAAEKDLAIAEEVVIARFGTILAVASDTSSLITTLDLNYLGPTWLTERIG